MFRTAPFGLIFLFFHYCPFLLNHGTKVIRHRLFIQKPHPHHFPVSLLFHNGFAYFFTESLDEFYGKW